MTNPSLIFALRIGYYDDPKPGATKDDVLTTPMLDVYFSAKEATETEEGIEIVEGDLWFFAADGTPLEADFAEKPFIDKKRNQYFAGQYSLKAGAGKSLPDVMAKIIAQTPSPHTRIIIHTAGSDEVAKWQGWKTATAMKQDIEAALKILPPDQAARVKFEYIKA